MKKKMNGIGTKATPTQPSNVIAQFTPIPSNIYFPKRGNMAATTLLTIVFAAIAEAAKARYESTM